MQTLYTIFPALVLVLTMTGSALAQEITTPYFALSLPADWFMPKPVVEQDNVVFALFVNKKDSSVVTITVSPGTLSAREVAVMTTATLKNQQGIESSEPVEKDGLYMTTFSKSGIRGISWYGSNGSHYAVTTVMSEQGPTLLRALKPVDSRLFPVF
ncbi:MAG: hypothetical protein IJU37_03605 [Desulfovibrio sp.]|nr:hypothetical protein [Desulfovibrio sp.]